MTKKLNVYLCDEKIGVLQEDELAQISFQYNKKAERQLSVRLPIREEAYLHGLAYPFFENLTPEGEPLGILTKDHTSGNKTFSILDRFGGDCAGAVAFYEITPDESKNHLQEISTDKFVQIIDKLPSDPLLTGMENPPRLSLAGAQSKFAILKKGDKYYRSDDKNPTTHIIKITNARFPNLLQNELFCMRLAQMLNLNAPKTELRHTDGRPYLEIERYDRVLKGVKIYRIHQEDFCQALGIVSDMKYQKGGGASLKACFGVINNFSSGKLTDIMRFIEWILFNYLIGNTDSHAKNISLLHTDSGIFLAPFYDLLSTEVYPEKIVDHQIAMLINGKGRYGSLKAKDFAALFELFNLNTVNTNRSLREKFGDIINFAEECKKWCVEQDYVADNKIYDDIIGIIKKRLVVLFFL